jgi:ABC-type polysaccharide/polyol phosphate transport system ATPase subunit
MSKVILKDVCVEFSKYTMRGKRGLVSNALGAGLQRKNFFALENINVELNKGDRVALLGQNGSGKSTLLRVLAGVLPPTSGELIVEGAVFPALNPAAGVMPKATCM